jgi:hypothetical protein
MTNQRSKGKRVRKPRSIEAFAQRGSAYVYNKYVEVSLSFGTKSESRRLARWLMRAATYLEQEKGK